ncbi:hypothetical protein O181_028964 [Austropuccinia psidii MF-1]|uniref:Uncharacterized protein n=1 Tax=Austropuccinia psidii MF-1 TaxID=1389203 RepID=A0A9Q3H446_9BASI|nr:hypothetical protein [Austropuccinia psidii MF-1]
MRLSIGSSTIIALLWPLTQDLVFTAIQGGSTSLDVIKNRLIIVSNRLPVTITSHSPLNFGLVETHHQGFNARPSYTFKESSGGLVSALNRYNTQGDFTWIGWSGLDVPNPDRNQVEGKLSEEYTCKTVWLSSKLADKY